MDKLVELPLNQALDLATTLLQETNALLPVSTQMLERLRLNLEEEEGTKRILKLLIMYGAPNNVLTDQLLQLLAISEYPSSIIECVAALAGNDEKNVEKIIIAFQDFILSACDSELWLNIVGALSELELTSERLRIKVFKLITESLEIVDEEDVPTVVRTLLRTVTKSTSQQIVRLVRKQCSGLSTETQYLLLQVIETSMKIESNLPKLFLNSFKMNFPCNPFDLCLLLSISAIDAYNKRANHCIFDALTTTGTTTTATLSDTAANNLKCLTISDIVALCKRTKQVEWESYSLPMFKFIQFILIQLTEHRNGAPLRRRMIQLCHEALNTLLCCSEECRGTIFTNLITITQCSPTFYRKLPDYKGKSDYGIVLDDNSYVSGAMISDMASNVLLTCAKQIPQLLHTHVHILEEELFRPRLSEKIILSTWTIHQLCDALIYIYRGEQETMGSPPDDGFYSSSYYANGSSSKESPTSNTFIPHQQSSYSSSNYSNLLVSVQKLLISGSNRISNATSFRQKTTNATLKQHESVYQQQRVGMIMAMHLLKCNHLPAISCKDIINWVLRLLGLIVNRHDYIHLATPNNKTAATNGKSNEENMSEIYSLNDIFKYGMDLLKENTRFMATSLCNEIICKILMRKMENERIIIKTNRDNTLQFIHSNNMKKKQNVNNRNITNNNSDNNVHISGDNVTGKGKSFLNILNGVDGKRVTLNNQFIPMQDFSLNCEILQDNIDNMNFSSGVLAFETYLKLQAKMLISKINNDNTTAENNNDANKTTQTLTLEDVSSLLSNVCVKLTLPSWNYSNVNSIGESSNNTCVSSNYPVLNDETITRVKKKRRVSLKSLDTNGVEISNSDSNTTLKPNDIASNDQCTIPCYEQNSIWYYEDSNTDIDILFATISAISSNHDKLHFARVCFKALSYQCTICNFIGNEIQNRSKLMQTNDSLLKDYQVIMFQAYRRFIWLRIKLDLLILNLDEQRIANAFANDFNLVQTFLSFEKMVKTEMCSPSFFVVSYAYSVMLSKRKHVNGIKTNTNNATKFNDDEVCCNFFHYETLFDLFFWINKLFSDDYDISGKLNEFAPLSAVQTIDKVEALNLLFSINCVEGIGKHCAELIHQARFIRRNNSNSNCSFKDNSHSNIVLQTIMISQVRIYTIIELLWKHFINEELDSVHFPLLQKLVSGFEFNLDKKSPKRSLSTYDLKEKCFNHLTSHLGLVEDSTTASKIVDLLCVLTVNVLKAVCLPTIIYKNVVQNIFPLQSKLNNIYVRNIQCSSYSNNVGNSNAGVTLSTSSYSQNNISPPWIVLDEYGMVYSGMLKMRQKTLVKETNSKLMLVDMLKGGGSTTSIGSAFPTQLVYIIHGLISSSFINLRTNSMIYLIKDIIKGFKLFMTTFNTEETNITEAKTTVQPPPPVSPTLTTTSSTAAAITAATVVNPASASLLENMVSNELKAISRDNFEIFYELLLKLCNCSLGSIAATINVGDDNDIVSPYDDFFIAIKQICDLLNMFTTFISDQRNYTYILLACTHSLRLSWKKFDEAIVWRTTNYSDTNTNNNVCNDKDWWGNKKLNVAIIASYALCKTILNVLNAIEANNKNGNTNIEILSELKELIQKFKYFLIEMKTLYRVEELSVAERQKWIECIHRRRDKMEYVLDSKCRKNFSIKDQWDKPIQNIETNFVESSFDPNKKDGAEDGQEINSTDVIGGWRVVYNKEKHDQNNVGDGNDEVDLENDSNESEEEEDSYATESDTD